MRDIDFMQFRLLRNVKYGLFIGALTAAISLPLPSFAYDGLISGGASKGQSGSPGYSGVLGGTAPTKPSESADLTKTAPPQQRQMSDQERALQDSAAQRRQNTYYGQSRGRALPQQRGQGQIQTNIPGRENKLNVQNGDDLSLMAAINNLAPKGSQRRVVTQVNSRMVDAVNKKVQLVNGRWPQEIAIQNRLQKEMAEARALPQKQQAVEKKRIKDLVKAMIDANNAKIARPDYSFTKLGITPEAVKDQKTEAAAVVKMLEHVLKQL